MIKFLEPHEEEKINYIYKMMNKYSKEVGFVLKPAIREQASKKHIVYIEDENKIVAVCNFNLRKDNITIIYEIVTDLEFRGKGYAKEIIKFLSKTHIVELKCPIDNKSNEFYKKIGFKLKEVQSGAKRKLNVWVGYKI
jgi:RimJ/RimL family protein N-acetyltransferase